MVIFDTSFEELANKYLKGKSTFTLMEKQEFAIHQKELELEIIEDLLYYDKICFKVYGENVPLIMLINIFGLEVVEELIDQDAIEFMLWTPLIVYPVQNIKGVRPLAYGKANSEPHCIPEVSLKLGFNWLASDLGTKIKKRLVKQLVGKYKFPPDNIAGISADLTWSAYESNKFNELGVPKKDDNDLNTDEKQKICDLANNIIEISVLADGSYISKNNYKNTQLITRSIKEVETKMSIDRSILELCSIENVPNIKLLYLEKKISINDILAIRKSGKARDFRNWLHSCTFESDNKSLSEEYINAITNPRGLFESKTIQLLKTITCYGLGLGISSLFSGPLLPFVGLSIGKALDIGTGLGLDLFDTFLVSSLTKGWTPKLYIEDIKKMTNK